ncbi:MAG: SBBP repeat-containing protein [Thaumarchaeota archaeon]|nr:SBBP repeat-containing protein [Nitrososphaerota archaeon]
MREQFKLINKKKTSVAFVAIVTVLALLAVVMTFPDKSLVTSSIDAGILAKVNLPFIQNQGQVNEDVKFYANTFAGTVFVTNNDITYTMTATKDSTNSVAFKERFLSLQALDPVGQDKSNALVNYFVGEKENWHSNVVTYNTVDLGQVWQSVDVKLNAYGKNVEKIFTVLPGGNVDDIKISVDGVKSLGISDKGELLLNTDLGSAAMTKPLAYQDIDGAHKAVNISYRTDGNTYGFVADNYDTKYPLTIDPLLASTFIGGSTDEQSLAIALDGSGNVFIAGRTTSTDYPTTVGAYQTSNGGGQDAFVSKFNNDLTSLQASTYLGGNNIDQALGIVLDGSGNVFVAGLTESSNYPTTVGAYDTALQGLGDVFVSKLSSDLTLLQASTYIGGSNFEGANAIALDGSGNVFTTGVTNSTNYPTTVGAYQTSLMGQGDVFVSELNSGLTSLQASTYVGGSKTDRSTAITLDGSGNVFVAGQSSSINYPTTVGAYQTVNGGGFDAFVSELNSGLTSLTSSTFIGGSGNDKANAIKLDGSGNVFVAGLTGSSNYPTTVGAYQTVNGGGFADAFVSELNSGLTSLTGSTLIGGGNTDQINAITLDGSGNVFVAGSTNSTNYPTTVGAYQTSNGGEFDAFVSELNSGLTTLTSSTFIGGSDDDGANAIILDGSGNVFVTGISESPDYPTTPGAYQTSYNAADDAFVSKLTSNLIKMNPTSISTTLSGSSIPIGSSITDSATLSGNTANAGGTVTYNIYNNTSCTGTPVFTSAVTVTNGVVPSSSAFTPSVAGGYNAQAVYSGDSNNAGSTSTCGSEPFNVPAPNTGRMTGGGSILTPAVTSGSGKNNSMRVTHGFELHCDVSQLPNNLEVNWDKGNKFHLDSLTTVSCTDDPTIIPNPPDAGFDTYVGTGTGSYNGVSGATAEWTFTDAGEPGKNDFAKIVIKDKNNVVVLSVSGYLNSGNQQAHKN